LGRGFSGMELHTPIRARSPDEYPPGNQVTPRAEIASLSHRRHRSALMLLPRMASPVRCRTKDTTRHAPPKYILVTMRTADKWESPRLKGIFLVSGLYCSQAGSHPAHLRLTRAVSHFGFIKNKIPIVFTPD